jgi:hypothetical protein
MVEVKKKVQLGKGVGGGTKWGREGEVCLGEDDMTRDQETTSGEVRTPIQFVIRGGQNTNTICNQGSNRGRHNGWRRGKLMGSNGRKVGVACTPKDAKMVVASGVWGRG